MDDHKLLLGFFSYDHLPKNLQETSKPFHDLASHIISIRPPDGLLTNRVKNQISMSLQKLLEAKDCAVRAALQEKKGTV